MPNFGMWEWVVLLVVMGLPVLLVIVLLPRALRQLRRWIVDVGREIRDEDQRNERSDGDREA
jgi:Sec-independent protein translocase protein TatA